MSEGEHSAEYFKRRAEEERELAAHARSDGIRAIHLALAENYQAAAAETEHESD